MCGHVLTHTFRQLSAAAPAARCQRLHNDGAEGDGGPLSRGWSLQPQSERTIDLAQGDQQTSSPVRVVLAPDQAGAEGVLGPGEVGVVEGMQ
mgnify:CR=1 FL=1